MTAKIVAMGRQLKAKKYKLGLILDQINVFNVTGI